MPSVGVRKRGGESASALLYRFSKKVKQSGVIKEFRKRKFHERTHGKRQRRLSAIHRENKRAELERMRKLGLL